MNSENASSSDTPPSGNEAQSERFHQVASIIDLMRPANQADGGDVELVEVSDGGVVDVRMHGACVGCPSSAITLKAGIERHLKDRIPGIQEVREVD